eukprot:maker-scaffold_15-snap-gene-7.37-mRNA-1 protein AED:0.01 eAED:0.01 QI:237/1/1/1/1/1/4/257/336
MLQSYTSMKVFNLFVFRDENKILIKEDIISEKCFSMWLASRKGEIKHPEFTFRRIICKHLRGKASKPFTPDVEKSILEKLRSEGGSSGDPFSECFKSLYPENVDRKKYLSWKSRYRNLKGFHETNRHEKIKTSVREDKIPSYSSSNSETSSVCLASVPNIPNFNSTLQNLLGLAENEFSLKLGALKGKGLDISSPAVIYLLSNFSNLHFHLTKEFIIPSKELCVFNQKRPMIVQTMDPKTWKVNYRNEYGRQVLGDAESVAATQLSVVEYLNKMRYILPPLKEKGCCWFRTIIKSHGKYEVLLGFSQIDEFGFQSSYMQKVEGFEQELYDYRQMLF